MGLKATGDSKNDFCKFREESGSSEPEAWTAVRVCESSSCREGALGSAAAAGKRFARTFPPDG